MSVKTCFSFFQENYLWNMALGRRTVSEAQRRRTERANKEIIWAALEEKIWLSPAESQRHCKPLNVSPHTRPLSPSWPASPGGLKMWMWFMDTSCCCKLPDALQSLSQTLTYDLEWKKKNAPIFRQSKICINGKNRCNLDITANLISFGLKIGYKFMNS